MSASAAIWRTWCRFSTRASEALTEMWQWIAVVEDEKRWLAAPRPGHGCARVVCGRCKGSASRAAR